jgi:hypothetical protein
MSKTHLITLPGHRITRCGLHTRESSLRPPALDFSNTPANRQCGSCRRAAEAEQARKNKRHPPHR